MNPITEWDLLTWACATTWALVVLTLICVVIRDTNRGGGPR